MRIAIADNGVGIRESFRRAGLEWSSGMDDSEAILKAFEPRVSSSTSPSNKGVGLMLVSQLAALTGGWLAVVSGSGTVRITAGGAPEAGALPEGAAIYLGQQEFEASHRG